ncbi:hypothetical protein [Cronobacter muytjensii]|uniref:hypothetical protein n=1 Tax=Cronobacter muytjensii TaxID=413501 RepID=UPI00157BEB02|nr:hypothetical protein [Cronobacter muytjensii]MBF4813036.1 hypothetical protein [Cronobacter muytjensii]
MKKLTLLAIIVTLAGCSSAADRMAKCEAQGISRDTCYIAEQNRQSNINAAAEKQALDNAAKQYAQSVHKHLPEGCTQVQDANGECDVKAPQASGSYKQIASEADHVMNKPISDAAEYLLSKGWKPDNGEWHKGNYTLRLIVENEVVVNSQLIK